MVKCSDILSDISLGGLANNNEYQLLLSVKIHFLTNI